MDVSIFNNKTREKFIEDLVCLLKFNSGILVTVSGIKHYFGSKVFSIGDVVHLVKEPGNKYDKFAIQVVCDGFGKCGYVADSPNTIKMGTLSAELIYGGIDGISEAEVLWVDDEFAVCELKKVSSYDLIFNWGVSLCSEGDTETALKLFCMLEEVRSDVKILQRIADCFFRLDKNDDASLYLEKALKLEPNNQRSLFMKKIISEKL